MRADALRRFHADPKRLFVHGYSTGANFAADLWQLRGADLAGFAFVSGGRYSPDRPSRPVIFSYGTGESDAAAFRRLGERLRKQSPKSKVLPHRGGHTYPQAQNEEIAGFLKGIRG